MLIDIFAPDWIDVLTGRTLSTAPRHRMILLIDGAFINGIHRQLDENDKRVLFDLLPSCNEKVRDVSPFLAEFQPEDRKLRALLARCSGLPMVNAIETPEDMAQLSTRLAAWSVVEAGGDRFNLRYADSRRIPAIFSTLTSEQRSCFCGPAVSWSFVDRDGRWNELRIGTETQQSPPSEFPPNLNHRQFAALMEDGQADEILAMMAYRGEKLKCRHSQAWRSIIKALQTAKTVGLDDSLTSEWAIWYVCEHSNDDASLLLSRLQQWRERKNEFEAE